MALVSDIKSAVAAAPAEGGQPIPDDTLGLPPVHSQGAVSGAAVIIATKILGFVSSFASLAIIARVLSPDDYGLVAMVVTVTSFLGVFSDLGLSYVTVQRPKISQDQLSALFWANVAFGVLLGTMTALLAPALVWFYNEPRLLAATLVLALTFPLAALGVQHQAILQRHMQFWRYGVVQILSTIVAAVAGVVLALLGWGYWSLILQSLLGLLAGTAVSWLVVRWLPGRPRRCADLREMLGFGGRLSAHGMVGYLSLNFDKMLLGRFCGALQLGLYATPYMLLGRLLSLSSYSVGQAAIPAMSRAEASADQMRQTYRRMLQLACLLGLPVCLMGLVWPRDMILTALGGHWIEATDVLWWLFVGGLPRLVGASTGWIWIATGRPGQMLRWEMVQSPLMAIAFVAGLPYGAKGVAMGFAVSSWILVAPGFAYCLRGSVLRAMDVIGPVLAPLACAAIGCLAGTLVQMAVAPDLKAGAARLAIRLAGAGLVYGIGASLCVPLVAEGLRKVRGKLSRAVVAAGTPLRGEDSRTGESGQ